MSQTIRLRDLAREMIRKTPAAPHAAAATARAMLLRRGKADSIGALLERQAECRPNQAAIRSGDLTLTYAQFNQRANQVAHYLEHRGVHSGDAVAVLMENRPEVLIAVAGIVKLGAIASMINTSQRGDILKHSLTLVEPRLIIVGHELTDALDEVRDQLPDHDTQNFLHMSDQPDDACPAGYLDLNAALAEQATTNPASTDDVLLDQPAYYIFTSGTTGLPKASIMSHLRWMRACYAMGQASLNLREQDVFYCCLPLYHNNALTLAWSGTLGSGACLALARKFSASRFWDDIRHYDASVFCYIGELCRYLLAQPRQLSDREHRVRACVGNGLRPDIWQEFKQRYKIEQINEFYGASEGNLIFTNAFNQDETAGFCPMSFAIIEYDIDADQPRRDHKGRLIKVKRGGTGLLITEVTERFGFEGYTDAGATEKKLLHDVFKSGDCWFNTGDLVRDQGFKHIQFVDRLGDTFRWKGENVATTEVEAAVNQWPQVEQSVVYGVNVPGADGRAGMAAVTPNVPLDEFDFAGLAEHLRTALPGYAIPCFIRMREAQDVTGTFKYRKVELKKQGFDPAACNEPVYLLDHDAGYRELTAALNQQIETGEHRL